jgi:hypothetical protein
LAVYEMGWKCSVGELSCNTGDEVGKARQGKARQGKARQGKAMAIGLLSKLGRQRQKQGEARVITSKENFW